MQRLSEARPPPGGPAIEDERHVFFIRPRRFGKSCRLTLLECYYDRTEKKFFERVFAGTDVGRDPTARRSRYVVVFFDFSAIRIDENVRIDYTRLRRLLVVNRQAARAELNGNFDLLRHVIAEEQADCRIPPSFPLDRLAERENFLSLMHFFGLLSIRGVAEGIPRLGIPNQSVKQLMYGYLRDAWRDSEAFTVDLYALERMMYAMACRGAWRPVLEFLADAVARQTGIRDYIAGEKVLHGFLAAYMGIADCFLFRSERELNGGCADICLEPFLAGHPQMRHGYLIELEYLKRAAGNAQAVEAAARQAGAQLRQYLAWSCPDLVDP